MENSIEKINIEPQEVHFEMVGKRPTEQEADNLLKFPPRKKPFTINKEGIKYKIKTFGQMIGYSIGFLLGGGFLFLLLTEAEEGTAIRGIMYLAVIASLLIGIGCFIGAFIMPFVSEKKKEPDKSFLAWLSSILGEDRNFLKKENRNIEYRIYVLDRMLPKDINIDKDVINQYITSVCEKITAPIDEITNKVCETYPNLEHAYTGKEIKIESETMLFPNVTEICATVTIKRVLNESGEFYTSAIVKLHVKQYIIKVENTNEEYINEETFCYPYDVMPEICIQA